MEKKKPQGRYGNPDELEKVMLREEKIVQSVYHSVGISGPLMRRFTFITPVKKIDRPTFVLKSESFMRGEPQWAGVSDALLLLGGREGPLGVQAF